MRPTKINNNEKESTRKKKRKLKPMAQTQSLRFCQRWNGSSACIFRIHHFIHSISGHHADYSVWCTRSCTKRRLINVSSTPKRRIYLHSFIKWLCSYGYIRYSLLAFTTNQNAHSNGNGKNWSRGFDRFVKKRTRCKDYKKVTEFNADSLAISSVCHSFHSIFKSNVRCVRCKYALISIDLNLKF